jgi:hypothetical protein
MRTEITLLALGALLCACPGELKHKAAFEAYAEQHGDAGAPASGSAAGADPGDGLAGTSPSGASNGGASDACGDVVARIFTPRCGGSGCHGASAPQQDLDLVSPGVASRVVGVSAKQCLKVLADPQNPEQSLLYQKLFLKPDCGAQMPLARPALSSADTACILAWIAAQ